VFVASAWNARSGLPCWLCRVCLKLTLLYCLTDAEKGAELAADALAQTGVSFADCGNLAGYSKVAFPVKLNPVSDGECSLSVMWLS
jgi:hypothetical protein